MTRPTDAKVLARLLGEKWRDEFAEGNVAPDQSAWITHELMTSPGSLFETLVKTYGVIWGEKPRALSTKRGVPHDAKST